ncbi:MAG: ABC transporter ATP-binding protein [Gammaproteobacteria bacterium]
MQPLIEAEGLEKRFGALHAVRGVTFTVARGEVLGFLGPNGAGKSTTMKMLTGFLEPSAGRARICGHDVGTEPIPARRHLGYVPEGAPLYGEMTVHGFLAFIAEARGLAGAERAARIGAAVDRVHLGSVLDQRVETLSKGFKRRVGVAQAILHDPDVLVMDEPTDGLDPNQKHDVRALIRTMAREKAIIISTHLLEEVDAVCTRAIIIDRGRIAFAGTPPELATRSRLHNAVRLAVRGPTAAQAAAAIGALPGIDAVEIESETEGIARLLARPQAGATIAGSIAGAAGAHGWTVEDLHVERGQLDEVFRAITTATDAAA